MDQIHPLRISRRTFVRGAVAAAAGVSILPRHAVARSGQTPPSERLNIAFVGAGGRGAVNLKCSAELEQNIVALCDVDDDRAADSFARHPSARKYRDFRRMLGELDQQLDAVVVSTPDHTHAVAAIAAMRQGKHVYCEKPVAHSIAEVRVMVDAARRHKVVTQMGNQGHSFDSIRQFCEWVWDGAIGNVHTVHAFRDSNYSRIDELPLLTETHVVPASLDWNLWLGPAASRAYHPEYLPGKWRGWMPFGTGVPGDWICHIVDPVFWALALGSPTTVRAEANGYDPVRHAATFPVGSVIRYEFPAKGNRGPVTLNWYDGSAAPPVPAGVELKSLRGINAFVLGDKGGIRYGSHGATGLRIFPEEQMLAYHRPAESLPRVAPEIKDRVAGHHRDWLDAIRNGTQPGSHFGYGGPLAEIALLGVIAIRMLGTTLQWDGPAMRFANSESANELLSSPFREGWQL